MTMNKQTVWLVTMLTLMVVLSAYYIVTGPVEPAKDMATKPDEQAKDNHIDVNIKTVGQPADDKTKEGNVTAEQQAGSDYFIAYQLQRNTLRQKMTEEYMKVLTNPEASKKELEEAEAKINQLMKVDKTESVLEELIQKEGFRDAVVITSDSHVDIIVQSDKLANAQAVKLINLVKQHIQIPSSNISVAYRP